ncbi:methyl-accepting chemotaxis protein [candidate division KSB1 bacterium]|nr:methyl-accepting chemotaxis protein [candidate division KSB1 bacterium]
MDAINKFCAESSQGSSTLANRLKDMVSKYIEELLSRRSDLQDIEFRSKELSTLSSISAKRISGEGILAALDGTWSILNSICIHYMLTQRKKEENLKLLVKITEYLSDFSISLEGFNNIVKMLKMLGTFTKVEGTRLNIENNGFEKIAEDVEKLADQIKLKYPEMQSQSEEITEHIEKTLDRLYDSVDKQNVRLDGMLETAQKDLESVINSQDTRIKFAKYISELTKKIHKSTTKVLSFVELDNSCIQKTNTLVSSLQEMSKQFIELPLYGDDPVKFSNEVQHAISQCELQSNELINIWNNKRHSNDQVAIAFFEIRDFLKEDNQLQESLNASFESETLFLMEVEKELQEIAEFAFENDKVDQEISATLSSLAKKAANLSSYIGSINEIGSSLELIGVNAQIKAAGAGEQGRAIGVLAEEIHKLSLDAHHLTNIVFIKLDEVISFGKKLISENNSGSISHNSEIENQIKLMRSKMKSLIEINQNVDSLLDRLKSEEEILFDDIKNTNERLGNSIIHENVIEDIQKFLKIIAIQTPSIISNREISIT